MQTNSSNMEENIQYYDTYEANLQQEILKMCTSLGMLDGELLASYAVPMIENAESICVDRARGCVWVGSDEDSPKLYRFEFSF